MVGTFCLVEMGKGEMAPRHRKTVGYSKECHGVAEHMSEQKESSD